ncbi:hypothetical protein PoB_006122800 [Plakobranchus ocellatus]|uniref:Secreted protein n=1 Tax=Plakobranchus ocellatus TaxID=259542 RepID=A0AAV4CS38_9GAST|nr:hypothetical protein PoB_006122800 [Plakobranchus ocellatus]
MPSKSGTLPVLPFRIAISSSFSVNSTSNVQLLAMGLRSSAFFSLRILGSATGSRGTVLTLEKCLVKASASFRSVLIALQFATRGSTRTVTSTAVASDELP